MKKIILCSVLISCTIASFAQTSTLTKNQYKRKAENQRKAGWIAIGVGIPMIGLGVLGFASPNDGPSGGIMMIAGTATTLSSIVLFSSARANEKRAMQATTGIKLDQPAYLPEKLAYKRSYPALSLKISF